MKHSIRLRFTALFLAVVAAVVLTALALNTWGLERFYQAEKVRNIENAYEAVNTEVMKNGTDSDTLSDILIEYSNKYNITISVMDSANSESIRSTERGSDYLLRRVQTYLFSGSYRNQSETLKKTENYVIISAQDEKSRYKNIDCLAYCSDNRTMLIMSTPVANIQECVSISNHFLLLAGIAALAVGILLVCFMTKQITRPIRRLAALSQKMGCLDFTERYDGKRQDEIGVLGSNMNVMAGKLEETITELKKANAELQEDIQKKIEIDEMRKAFIANVSHELKTPIALIQGYAEGLNDGLCEDPDSRKYYLDVIIDEANKMNSLVKQLLTLSKLESGAPELDIEAFDLAELVRGVLGNTKIMADGQKAELSWKGTDGDPEKVLPVRGDEFKIEEVLTNYVSNAAHHVNEGGSITVSAAEDGDRIRVDVFNTGSRIPEEDIGRIWDKFYKVDKAHSRAYGGSGIGLSIVKAVMEAHKMPFGVENREDGVDFWFELPKSLEEEETGHTAE